MTRRVSRTAGFIYARSDSSRIPRKIFSSINDMSLLEIVFSRAKNTNLDEVYLVTSSRSVDDELCSLAATLGMGVVRGDGYDVVSRTLHAISETGVEYFARINGDSPLLDPALIDLGLSVGSDFKFMSNLFNRRSPYGVSLEVINSEFYKSSVDEGGPCVDREHITKHIYSAGAMPGFIFVNNSVDHSHLSYTVDEPEQLVHLRDALVGKDPQSIGYWEIEDCAQPKYRLEEVF